MKSETTLIETEQVEPATTAGPDAVETEMLLEELLVEEISIDGMCGVY